jgi:hypothetical protein
MPLLFLSGSYVHGALGDITVTMKHARPLIALLIKVNVVSSSISNWVRAKQN